MNESEKRNKAGISATVWCFALTVFAGAILRVIEMAGGHFTPISSIKLTADLIWQIPLIPRWLDAIVAVNIWAIAIVFIKNQKDGKLESFGILFFMFGVIITLIDGNRPTSVLFGGVGSGVGVAMSVLLLFYIGKLITRSQGYSKISICIFAAIGYVLGTSFIYAFAYGIIFGVLFMAVSLAISGVLIFFVMSILNILITRKISADKQEESA